jgi:hypothetical protein
MVYLKLLYYATAISKYALTIISHFYGNQSIDKVHVTSDNNTQKFLVVYFQSGVYYVLLHITI